MGEHLELTIETLAQGGDGIGRVDGKVVFVPFALPGERVRVEIAESGRQFDRASLVEVIEPAPERVAARCPVYGACGGCRFQHVGYDVELRLKNRLLGELCRRIPGFEVANLESIRPSPSEWRYRCRIQVHVARGRVGFRGLRSHRIAPTTSCCIADERLERVLSACSHPEINARLTRLKPQHRIELRVGEAPSPVHMYVKREALDPKATPALARDLSTDTGLDVRVCEAEDRGGALEWRVSGRTLHVRGAGFVQANPEQNRALVALVGEMCARDSLGPVLVDLFCGAGNFACTLADQYERVIGADLQPAIADARRNAQRLRLPQCEFHPENLLLPKKTHVQAWLPEGAAVILDPPRGGAKKLAPMLAERRPELIAYVSCDPPAFARDAQLLYAAGYRLNRVIPFDMFPKTADVELVGFFTPQGSELRPA